MSGAILTGRDITQDQTISCDVCVIGSGAGGGVLAEGLVARGLDVVMLEAGGYHTRQDFDLQESKAYPMLYQERGARATSDGAITVLQGHAVGGSTWLRPPTAEKQNLLAYDSIEETNRSCPSGVGTRPPPFGLIVVA